MLLPVHGTFLQLLFKKAIVHSIADFIPCRFMQ